MSISQECEQIGKDGAESSSWCLSTRVGRQVMMLAASHPRSAELDLTQPKQWVMAHQPCGQLRSVH